MSMRSLAYPLAPQSVIDDRRSGRRSVAGFHQTTSAPPDFIPFAGLRLSRLRGGDNAPMNSYADKIFRI